MPIYARRVAPLVCTGDDFAQEAPGRIDDRCTPVPVPPSELGSAWPTLSLKQEVLFSARLGKRRRGAKVALPAARATDPVASPSTVVTKPGSRSDAVAILVHGAELYLYHVEWQAPST